MKQLGVASFWAMGHKVCQESGEGINLLIVYKRDSKDH